MKIRRIRRRGRRGGAQTGRRRPAGRSGTQGRVISPRVREHVTRLVVDVGNRASAWRDAAGDAELAYRWWQRAPKAQRGDAAAVYLAAIEREEKAAAEYRRVMEACCNTTPDTVWRPL
jgi:hypothetical protein